MRTIDPPAEPPEYAQWRAASQGDINYGYDLIPGEMRDIIKEALIAQQRGLCAYTGIGIALANAHIEHLVPQAHCQQGEGDVAYANMVACYPAPGSPYVPFGALRKGSWPSPDHQHLFVSPRSLGCENRFRFNLRGVISVANDDAAARETVTYLGLDHRKLESFRKEAIQATLMWHGRNEPLLSLTEARKRLASLEQAEAAGGQLDPFCFVLKQALQKHIIRLASIRESKRNKQHG